MKLEATSYQILYQSRNITKDVSDHLISIEYTDKVQGESDELNITLDDKEGLWKNDWYPQKGDAIEAYIIDAGLSLYCGKFSIDELSFSGGRGGDTVTISCLATSIVKSLRTKKSTAHENKTLRQLADSVARIHGLTVVGSIPDIRFGRVTQNQESDLSFLNRLASMWGIIFSVRDTQLIFQNQKELESKSSVISIDKTECTDYSFNDTTQKTFKGSRVKYHNPESNETVEHTELADDAYTGGEDYLELRGKVENKQQAEVMAKSRLNSENKKEKTAKITAPGKLLFVSGNNVELTGYGKLSGIYHITESVHSISRDGYASSFEAKKVDKIATSKYHPRRSNNSNSSAQNAFAQVGMGRIGALEAGAEAF